MPLILNGSSLLKNTSGGLATTVACCCGGPKECREPDFCQYRFAITSPAKYFLDARAASGDPCTQDIQASFEAFSCGPDQNCTSDEDAICGEFPASEELDSVPFSQPQYNTGYGYINLGLAGANYASLSFYQGLRFFYEATDEYGNTIWRGGIVNCLLGISVRLGFNYELREFYATAYWYLDILSTGEPPGYVKIYKQSTFALPTKCEKAPSKTCADFATGDAYLPFYQLETPVNITVSMDTVGGGPVETIENTVLSTEQTQVLEECLYDKTFQFQINSVDCTDFVCSCNSLPSGLYARIDGEEFVTGTAEDRQVVIDGQIFVWKYFGDTFWLLNVYQDEDHLNGNAPSQIKFVNLACDTDTETDPPVGRWYAILYTACYEYAGFPGSNAATKATEDQFIGYFFCVRSSRCGQLGDQFVWAPLGSPMDVERMPGFPNFVLPNPCDPPEALTIEILEEC